MMKKSILILALLFTICFSFTSFISPFQTNTSSIIENGDWKFVITGDYETVIKEVESIMKMERDVKSCTIEVTILSSDNEPIKVSMKSITCYTTAKLMKGFLETIDELGYKI